MATNVTASPHCPNCHTDVNEPSIRSGQVGEAWVNDIGYRCINCAFEWGFEVFKVGQLEIGRIVGERLESWGQRLTEAHSTPVLMLAIGHDHRSGHLTLLVPEGVSKEQLRAFLSFALKYLE